MENAKVWLITGASKGLGYELATHLLDKGYKVIATSRDASKINIQNDNFFGVSMEVTNEESISLAIKKAIDKFGRIDVLVNNAGYGLLGTIEELSVAEIRNVFDVNVFGLINVSKAVLPIMRAQRSGYILNVASISGSVGTAGTGVYSATKAAVLQLSEALAKDVEEFGIHVTAVCPGGFRTDFLDKSSLATPQQAIDDYSLVRNVLTRFGELNQNQGGDPQKAADVFVKLAEMPQPPARFYMGSDAVRMIGNKINEVTHSVNTHIDLSQQTDY